MTSPTTDGAMNESPSANVFALFPIPVVLLKGVVPIELCNKIIDFIQEASQQENPECPNLLHTETQSPPLHSTFLEVGALLTPCLMAFGELLFGEEKNWFITSMWTNIMLNGGRQSLHNHVNSFVSGVVYLTDVTGNSRTTFHRDPGGSGFDFRNQSTHTKLGKFSANGWKAPVTKKGDAILFPSYLMHHVPANEGETRMTLAFNSVPETLDCNNYKLRFLPQ